MIYIVGLGAGDINQLTVGVSELLKAGYPLYLRTDQHPMVNFFAENNIEYVSFDHIYESHDNFAGVYQQIIDEVSELGKEQDIIYAVPGHPYVAEYTVKVLGQLPYAKIIGGQSFIDPIFASLKIDPIEGFQMMDALAMDYTKIITCNHLLIPQLFDQMIASDVKLDLMECYPDEHEVCIISAAGSALEKLTWKKLYELDHDFVLDNLLTLYVPPMTE